MRLLQTLKWRRLIIYLKEYVFKMDTIYIIKNANRCKVPWTIIPFLYFKAWFYTSKGD
jgi:hypothetical protein